MLCVCVCVCVCVCWHTLSYFVWVLSVQVIEMQKDLKEFSATLDIDTYDKGVKLYHKIKKAGNVDQD